MFDLFFKSLFSKFQNLAFFKTEFGLFQSQAPGNPAGTHTRACAHCTHTCVVQPVANLGGIWKSDLMVPSRDSIRAFFFSNGRNQIFDLNIMCNFCCCCNVGYELLHNSLDISNTVLSLTFRTIQEK